MQQKVHMQDQIKNRIEMLMDEQHRKTKQIIDDMITIVLCVGILALGVVW